MYLESLILGVYHPYHPLEVFLFELNLWCFSNPTSLCFASARSLGSIDLDKILFCLVSFRYWIL